MTTTPTASDLATFRNDLQRVAHLLASATDAHRRQLETETLVALERASVLVDSLGEVLDWWRFAGTPKPSARADIVDKTLAPTTLAEEVAGERLGCDWDGCTAEPFATAQALASHKRKHARDQLKADAHDLRVEAEARAAVPKPAAPKPAAAPVPPLAVVADTPSAKADSGRGATEQIGAYEVRTIGKRRFVRCPEVMCALRVALTDEETQYEIADALHSHSMSGECLARAAAGRR